MGTVYIVEAGQVVSGAVLSWASQNVMSGGTAVGTTACSVGWQNVSSGGRASGTVVSSGGGLLVSSGGTALGIVQKAGGRVRADVCGGDVSTLVSGVNAEGGAMFLSGGVASGFILYRSFDQIVSSGGTAFGTVASSEGRQIVSSGGTASGTIVFSDGQQAVSAGGSAFGTVVSAGGSLSVSAGGKASGTVVSAGGVLFVSAGGTALGVVQKAGGRMKVTACSGSSATLVSGTNVEGGIMRLSRGTATGFLLCSGDELSVFGRCKASGTVVSSGGSLSVSSGGSAVGIVQKAGGQVCAGVLGGDRATFVSGTNAEGGTMILSAGTATGFVLYGLLTVSSGGTAAGTVVSSGGRLSVYNDGTALDVVQHAGGNISVNSRAFVTGTNAHGLPMLMSGGTASGFILYSTTMWIPCMTVDMIVSHGGRQYVSGIALGTVLSDEGWQIVSSRGFASGTSVLSGGQLYVYGGSAVDVVQAPGGNVNANAMLDVFVSGVNASGEAMTLSEGFATGFIFYSGGTQSVYRECLALNTVLSSGGLQRVMYGGMASGTVVSSGGRMNLHKHASAAGACICPGGAAAVFSGGRESGSVVHGALGIRSGASGMDEQVFSGGALNVDGIARRASILSGGRLNLLSGGRVSGTAVSSGGLLIASSGGVSVSASIAGGGRIIVQSGGTASGTVLKAGARLTASSGAMLSGKNSIAGGSISGTAALASGAQLFAGAGTDMSKFSLDVSSGGVLVLTGSGVSLKSLALGSAARIVCNLSKQTPAGSAAMLSLGSQNSQGLGVFSAVVGKTQAPGSYALADGLVQGAGQAWSVVLGGSALGSAAVGGAALKAEGMSYAVQAAGGSVVLEAATLAGWMKRGDVWNNNLNGSENGDVFFGSGGNDRIFGNGGRDCAVYGTEDWGRDRIAETSGTMTLVFSGLARGEVASSLRDGVMTFAKKSDRMQRITVSGWNAETHSAVFASAGSMKSFEAWASVASPTLAQARAARAEVWKKAGLAAA